MTYDVSIRQFDMLDMKTRCLNQSVLEKSFRLKLEINSEHIGDYFQLRLSRQKCTHKT